MKEITVPVTGQAKGRNGYFKAREVEVMTDSDPLGEHPIYLSIRSKRHGRLAPIWVTLTQAEALSLASALTQIAG